ncbi:MAG: hypothetical protein MHM6MM_002052 [Cercozoa sp. M6MM]
MEYYCLVTYKYSAVKRLPSHRAIRTFFVNLLVHAGRCVLRQESTSARRDLRHMLQRKTVFVGDIHGDRDALLALLTKTGLPSETGDTLFVFLGDYVDRNAHGIDVLMVCKLYTIGNHDSGVYASIYARHSLLLLSNLETPESEFKNQLLKLSFAAQVNHFFGFNEEDLLTPIDEVNPRMDTLTTAATSPSKHSDALSQVREKLEQLQRTLVIRTPTTLREMLFASAFLKTWIHFDFFASMPWAAMIKDKKGDTVLAVHGGLPMMPALKVQTIPGSAPENLSFGQLDWIDAHLGRWSSPSRWPEWVQSWHEQLQWSDPLVHDAASVAKCTVLVTSSRDPLNTAALVSLQKASFPSKRGSGASYEESAERTTVARPEKLDIDWTVDGNADLSESGHCVQARCFTATLTDLVLRDNNAIAIVRGHEYARGSERDIDCDYPLSMHSSHIAALQLLRYAKAKLSRVVSPSELNGILLSNTSEDVLFHADAQAKAAVLRCGNFRDCFVGKDAAYACHRSLNPLFSPRSHCHRIGGNSTSSLDTAAGSRRLRKHLLAFNVPRFD